MKQTILALDIATKTGWCTKDAHGTWNLKALRDESAGMRLIRFKGKLREIIPSNGITFIAFEMSVGAHQAATNVQSELIGVMKLICLEEGIEFSSYPPSSIKKFATGKGNANKDAMVNAAQELLGMVGDDDNEADAMWIYQYVLSLGI